MFQRNPQDLLLPEDLKDLPRFAAHLPRDGDLRPWVLVGLYVDAAPYTKYDSFYVISWNPIHSRTRHVITVVRKQQLCRCGCKGKCTINAVMRVIAWSMLALRAGKHPVDGA